MANEAKSERSIDGFSIFGLILVLTVMIPVLFPIDIRLGRRVTRALRRVSIKLRILSSPSSHQDNSDQNFKTYTNHPERDLKGVEGSNCLIGARDDDTWTIPISLNTAPPFAVLLLLATTTIDGGVVRDGIVGEGDSKPYDVLVLFICLAYIAIALDSTGALQSLALYVSNRSNGSGPQLYFILYWFFFVLGIIFGNDPIILSGTAFLTYFLKHCGIVDPTAWIFMEFVASNISSAVLVSSNPTNVLIAQAFDLNFLTGFTKYTVLPSVITGIAGYVLLYTMFRLLSVPDIKLENSKFKSSVTEKEEIQEEKSEAGNKTDCARVVLEKVFQTPILVWRSIPRANYIPDHLNQPRISPLSTLVDPQRAYFHGTLMVVTLVLLVGTSFIKNVSVWKIALPGGCIALLRDLMYDLFRSSQRNYNKNRKLKIEEGQISSEKKSFQENLEDGVRNPSKLEKLGLDGSPGESVSVPEGSDQVPRDDVLESNQPPEHLVGSSKQCQISESNQLTEKKQEAQNSSSSDTPETSRSKNEDSREEKPDGRITLESSLKSFKGRFPDTSETIKNLPLPLLPFAMSMFILVSSLKYLGWVRIFASWFSKVCLTPVKTVYFVGFLTSLVFCPIMGTNIGATILLVNIISDRNFQDNLKITSKAEKEKIIKSAIYSIGLGSNIGAFSLTISSSLAGLLWVKILNDKNLFNEKRRWKFLSWNFIPILALSLVAYSFVLVEVLYIF